LAFASSVTPRRAIRAGSESGLMSHCWWAQETSRADASCSNPTAPRQRQASIPPGALPRRVVDGSLKRQISIPGLRHGQSSSRTSRSASFSATSSSCVTRPTKSPSRSGATADVCSINTCVGSLFTVIVGRKMRGGADRDVGATSKVDSMRSSDCTMTAYRLPCCSLPRAPRGVRSRWMSPRTKLAHVRQHFAAFSAVSFIIHQGE
jgi:hypothetical protein